MHVPTSHAELQLPNAGTENVVFLDILYGEEMVIDMSL